MCTMPNVRVQHDHKEGVIGAVASGMATGGGTTAGRLIKAAGFDKSIRDGEKILIPKLIKVNTTLIVVNDHPVGWDHQTGHWRGSTMARAWPYKFGLVRDTKDEPSMSTSGNVNEDSTPPAKASDGAEHPPGSPHAQQSVNSQTVINDTNADVGIEEKSWGHTGMQGG